MASKHYSAYNAGYNQPHAPPPYSVQPAGHPYSYQPLPVLQQSVTPQINQNTTNTTVVVNPNQPQVVLGTRQKDWLVPAILATIFCFFPTGIGAIIAAVAANSARDEGDVEGAKSSAAWARGLTLVSVLIGVLIFISMIVVYVVVISKTVKSVVDDITNPFDSDI